LVRDVIVFYQGKDNAMLKSLAPAIGTMKNGLIGAI